MRPVRPVLVLVSALLLGACAATPTPRAVETETVDVVIPAHDNLNATLWVQTSAEYEAAVRGVFASARVALDQALADPTWNALPHGEFGAAFVGEFQGWKGSRPKQPARCRARSSSRSMPTAAA